MALMYFRSRVERSYVRLRRKAGEFDPCWFDGEVIIDEHMDNQKSRLLRDVENTKEQLKSFARETEEDYRPKAHVADDSMFAFIATTEGNECIFAIMEYDAIPQTTDEWKQFFPKNLMDKFGKKVPRKLQNMCENCVLRPNLLTVTDTTGNIVVFDLYENRNEFTRKEAEALREYKMNEGK